MKKDEWYTPPEIFKALGIVFELDPCHPVQQTFVPASNVFTRGGLSREWFGNVWLNPPFGNREGYLEWVEKFIRHGNGIGLMPALTSSRGFQRLIPKMEAILFPKGKTRFYESIDKKGGCPTFGVILFALGKGNCLALKNSNLGMYFNIKKGK